MTPSETNGESRGIKRWLKDWLAAVKEALTSMEDQWTWTTRDGAVYEDVEVEDLQGDKVVLRHKFGTVCLPIADLSEESRLKLEHDYPAQLRLQANHKTIGNTQFGPPARNRSRPQ